MDDIDEWPERDREIRACSATYKWRWYVYIYIICVVSFEKFDIISSIPV